MGRDVIPFDGRVDGRAIRLDDGDEVPEGARAEGWVLEDAPTRVATGPMTANEAKRLLGPAVVTACTRRGIDARKLDWAVPLGRLPNDLPWYKVIPVLDHANPWPIWLPLFAHLLRLTETAPDEVWWHMSDVHVVTTKLLKLYRRHESVASNARLIALLLLRLVELCGEESLVRPHYRLDIQNEANLILRACVEAEEGSIFRP